MHQVNLSSQAAVNTALRATLSMIVMAGLFLIPPPALSDQSTAQTIMGKDGAPMAYIPAGPFPMGVPSNARDGGRDEYPNHEVTLSPYYIDLYEVTNGRYWEFVHDTAHRTPHHPSRADRDIWEGGLVPDEALDRPVINVDWYDAQEYCRWADKRLPTEAEWAKAARGNDERRFPWGNVEPTDAHLNYGHAWTGLTTLTPVGTYEAGKSPYGLYDVAGNVWEWVADWYDPDYYSKSPTKDPLGPETGTHKVIRSSGWQVEPPQVRIFTRVKSHPKVRNESTGFRCAADVAAMKIKHAK